MGGRFKTKSSAELPGLSVVVAWATACRLVRASRGRLVPVKKSAVLLGRPDQLWDRMLEVFGLLGEELCPGGWSQSVMRHHFPAVVDAVFDVVPERREPLAEGELCALAWELVSARYHLEELTERQLATARAINDRDLRGMLATLEQLGALDRDGDAVTLSERAATGVRRVRGEVGPTDAVLQIKISLLGVSKPPVWRRLLVPAGIRLDRFRAAVSRDCSSSLPSDHPPSRQGSTISIPVPRKSSTLRVASVAPRTRQIAAICASKPSIGVPSRSRA